MDPDKASFARKKYNLKPIVAEKYTETNEPSYAVAVVRKSSGFKNFQDLRGAKSCHTGIDSTAGYVAPLYALVKKGLIDRNSCPLPKALSEFFSGGSCLPGAKTSEYDLQEAVTSKLCSLCKSSTQDPTAKCSLNATEAYSGYAGALRCLVEGGDVAFVKQDTVIANTGTFY